MIEILDRTRLNEVICPKCRADIIGRASDMENFLLVHVSVTSGIIHLKCECYIVFSAAKNIAKNIMVIIVISKVFNKYPLIKVTSVKSLNQSTLTKHQSLSNLLSECDD